MEESFGLVLGWKCRPNLAQIRGFFLSCYLTLTDLTGNHLLGGRRLFLLTLLYRDYSLERSESDGQKREVLPHF